MTKARGLADLGNVYNDGALSNRNLIINGAMQVAQRGASFTSNGYGLDRWKTYNSGGTATLSQQTFTSGSSPEVGLDTYVRIVRSSPSGIYYFSQRVEDVRKSDGATLTLSFYAKASSATTIPCRITQEFGTGGSAGVNITAQDSNVTTSWQKFSLTFNMASLAGKTIGTGSRFEPVFDIPATTATIEITGVQLELGDTATPFEHRSYGDELAKCQRYYERWDFPVSFDWYVTSSAASAHDEECPYNGAFAVAKRATPTYSRGGTFFVSNLGSNDWTARPNTNSITFYNGTSAAGRYFSYNSTSAYLAFDAEL